MCQLVLLQPMYFWAFTEIQLCLADGRHRGDGALSAGSAPSRSHRCGGAGSACCASASRCWCASVLDMTH